MKFQDTKKGEVFEDLSAARFAFCNQKCKKCHLSCWNNEDKPRCDLYCRHNPIEAAHLMGYEVLEDG